MKKNLYSLLLLLVFLFLGDSPVRAQGWPANYSGVMLQGFYWDSYSDSRWTVLEKQADELSKYFDLVWIPQSGNCGGTSMGYDDQYWFSDYNSSFGNKEELLSMIKTFKSKGIGTIGDIVVNHRKSNNGWFGFPSETYNGVTYTMTSKDVCSDDDSGKAQTEANRLGVSLGAKDTGEGWDGMRDLDHTSTNVQNTVKAYLKMLIDDFGYTGFRYDMVKGYSGSYTATYNTYAKPQFSVGECWDSSNTIKNWIDATKVDGTPTSAAFDFQFRYTVRNAINNNDWRRLGQQNDGNWPLISTNYNYGRWAVTFVENHDTEKRSNAAQDPIKKDTLAANAYLLAMPGTPCVFLTHWIDCKQDIKAMIDVRKAAGIHNQSAYLNMASQQGYYAMRVTGNNGQLIVAVGNNVNSYKPNDNFVKVLSGYHYAYYLHKDIGTAWADLASGTYSGAQKVTLTAVSNDANAKLVYTTDGSDPTASSTSVASGTQINIPAETEMTLKVGLLTGGTVKNIITREYSTKKPVEEPFTIPSCCTRSENEICAFFEAPFTWTNTISCWAWTNSPSDNFTYANKGWPGVKCEKVGTTDAGNSVWKWTWDGTKQNNSSATQPAYIIFNNTSSPQTSDLTFTNGGYYQEKGLKGTVVATGIREISAPTNDNNKVYTIDGRVVRDQYDLNGLSHGIYIYKGKKVVR